MNQYLGTLMLLFSMALVNVSLYAQQEVDTLASITEVKEGLHFLNFQLSNTDTLTINCDSITIGELLHSLNENGISIANAYPAGGRVLYYSYWALILADGYRIRAYTSNLINGFEDDELTPLVIDDFADERISTIYLYKDRRPIEDNAHVIITKP